VAVCCGYCREQWLCDVGTVGNSGCVLWLLLGTMAVCCGYCREQWLCAVGNVGKVALCCEYCREQCVCDVGTVGNSGCVLWVL